MPELPEEWRFDSEIEQIEHLGCERVDSYGTIWHQKFTMTDGATYNVDTSDPFNRRVNVMVGSTTALGTKNDGLYRRLQLNLMRMGYPGLFISTEQDFEQLGLARSGHNMLKIFQREAPIMAAEPDKLIKLGISQGAMKALAEFALAPHMGEDEGGIKIIYGDLHVACFFEGLDLSHPIDTAKQYLRQGVEEVSSLRRHIGEIPLKVLMHYPRTIDLSPKGLRSAAHSLPVLVSGETGEFPPYIPKGANIRLEAFAGDSMSQPEIARAKFKDHPNVEVYDDKVGGHLECAGEGPHNDFVNRMSELARQIENLTDFTGNVDYEKIDFSTIHLKEQAQAA